jgi:hypothetical protein
MDDLQTLLDSGVDFGMLAAGSITDDILMHLKGPSVKMHRLCCKTLVRICLSSDSEQHKEHIQGSGVIKELMNILEICQRQESSSALDTETICVVMNAIVHLIDCPRGIKIDDGIPLFHRFFAKSDFEVKTSSLHVLKNLCFNNAENAIEISRVAPKIMLSLADMLVCKDEEIHRSVLQLIFNLAVFAPALVNHMDFPTDIVIKPVLKIIRNESENLPKTDALGLGILSTIVTWKGKYKVALAQLGVIPMSMQTVQSDNRQLSPICFSTLIYCFGKVKPTFLLQQVYIINSHGMFINKNLYHGGGTIPHTLRRISVVVSHQGFKVTRKMCVL